MFYYSKKGLSQFDKAMKKFLSTEDKIKKAMSTCVCKEKGETDIDNTGAVFCSVCYLPVGEIDDYEDWELAPESRVVNVYEKKDK